MKFFRVLKIASLITVFALTSCRLVNAVEENNSGSNEKHLEITSMPEITNYEVGQMLSYRGMVISDRESKEVIRDYETDYHEGYVFKSADVGEFKVTISKDGYKSTFLNLNVASKALALQSNPTKVHYLVGDSFSLDGMIVVDSESRELITGYNTTLANGYTFTLSDVGNKTVTISKSGYTSVEFQITIDNDSESTKLIDIYATNDIHGQIESQAYRSSIGKVMTYMKSKGDQDNTLLLDQGDTWQGSIYSNYNHGELITDLMNYVKYDARTVGNHDFDWGTTYIASNKLREYNNYKTPVLAANVYDFNFSTKVIGNNQQSNLGDKTVTYTLENGLKVGIIGTIGKDQITSINSLYTQQIAFKDHISVIKEEATKLRNEGCDIIISSNHCGQEDVLNKNLSNYVDLVLCAHTHQEENTMENGLLFAQFGAYNQYIGHIQIAYDVSTKSISYTVNDAITASQIDSNVKTIDSTINSIVTEYNNDCDAEANATVASNVSGSFSSSEQMPNLMCRAMYEAAVDSGYNVDLAYCNNARASLNNKKQWTYADLYQAFPFDNEIYIIDVTAEEMALEVARYNFVCRFPSFNGKIEAGHTYRIACIDYLAFHTNSNRYYDYFPTNAGNYVGVLDGNYRTILRQYLKDGGFGNGTSLSQYDYLSSQTRYSRAFTLVGV